MKKNIRILLITAIVIFILILGFWLFLPKLVEHKLEDYVSENTDYELSIESLYINANSIIVRGAVFKPKLKRDDFFKSKGYQTDWIKTDVSIIKIKGINWIDILNESVKKIHYVDIEQAQIYVYRDKTLKDRSQFKPLPQKILREMKQRIIIPEVNLINCNVVYEELNAQTEKIVPVSFNKLNAKIKNICTDNVYMEQNPEMIIEGSALILDSIDAQIHFTTNLLNKNDEFKMSGKLGSFSATHLNRCIEPATKTRIVSGKVNAVKFHFTADNDQSNGKLDIDYSDLKLKVDEEVKQHNIKTFVANIFVKDHDKKDDTGKYTGDIKFNRRKDRFIFNYWWHSLKTGIVSSVLKKPVANAAAKKVQK